MNQTCGLRNITGSNAEYYNNTIIVPHAVNISYGITNNESPVITNNIIFSHDHGIHGAIVINTYNYIFTNGQTDYFNNSQGIGDVNQARGVIAPVFVNIPIAYGQTRDGIDADDVYTGDTDTIEVLDCQDGRFVATTEYFEYDKDGIARQITAINCDAGNSFIDFSPALSAPSEEGKSIRLWGTNNTNFVVDYRLSASNSPSLLYGGKNLSGTFITDINGITRTTSNSGQDNDNDSTPNEVTDDGDGWSMSAYEYE